MDQIFDTVFSKAQNNFAEELTKSILHEQKRLYFNLAKHWVISFSKMVAQQQAILTLHKYLSKE